jgi:hypothetical protein
MYTEIKRFNGLDRNVLVDNHAYAQYFTYCMSVFERVLEAYNLDDEGNRDDIKLLHTFLQRLLNSIDCFRLKYLFEKDAQMKIDQSDSSFPNNIEFMYLSNDVSNRDEKLAKLSSRQLLQKQIISWIYERKEQPTGLQHELAFRIYLEQLQQPEKLFFEYTPGEIVELSSDPALKRASYMYSWGVFESSLNMPIFYQMLFEVDIARLDNNMFRVDAVDDFHSKIKFATSSLNPLQETAETIDRSTGVIYPKELKRFIIGPLYGKYSLDEEPISVFLRTIEDPDALALEVQREIVKSSGEQKGKKLFEKSAFQQFEVSTISREAIERKVTDYKNFLFTPHAIGQQLLEAESLSEKILTYKVISLKNKTKTKKNGSTE